jgi:hypothetical protein
MDYVRFMTMESGDDLIVSFAVPADLQGDVKSIILLRTPKHEMFLAPWERGVSVSYDDFRNEEEFDMLQSISFDRNTARIITRRRTYALDLHDVEPDSLQAAVKILRKMNFDGSFLLKVGDL